ncbi:hypothetical protein [Aquimarina sp. AU474]|uniref:hypothetical protein n=1 Tax=Aquimarina sp. AU474 TaxID=2108529 RepID=UPI000D692395|nr:hypothetical protein [Aquimarina sp. AU474]
MTTEELDIKKFELEQKIKLEELELKKRELDLRLLELKRKKFSTPLIISVIGGLITIITGITLNYFESSTEHSLEDKKFQSSLLLKVTDSETYEEFSNRLVALQENGLLSIDSTKIARYRKERLIAQETEKFIKADSIIDNTSKSGLPQPNKNVVWTIVAGGDSNMEGASFEKSKAEKNGFSNVSIWYRNNAYRTCMGRYSSNTEALNYLFNAKEKINQIAHIVRLDNWCPNSIYDADKKIYICN